MGMPEMNIAFMKLAETIKVRSMQDIVCIITKDENVTGMYTYSREKQIKENYSEGFLTILKEAFTKYGVYKIVVYSIKGEDTFEGALKAIKKVKFGWLAFNFNLEETEQSKVKEFIDTRLELNMPIQVICVDYPADNKYITNFTATGLKVNNVAMESYQFSLKVAFILATLPATKSATYYVLDDVTAADEIEDEDTAVKAGKLFITYDGEKYKLSRAVNSMTTVKDNDKKDMKKIKIVSGRNLLHTDIFSVFRDQYTGQCNNEYADRLRFIAEVNNTYLKRLEGSVLKKDAGNEIQLDVKAMRDYIEADVDADGDNKDAIDTTDMTDEEVEKDVDGYCGSKVFTTGFVRFADAMEDLDLNMYY